MKAPRLAVGAVVCSLAASQLAAPSAHAYETTYDTMTDTCTITFTETDAERTNNAYSGLFLRLAEQVRDSFEGEQAKADAAIVYEYGSRADVKSASDLPIPADLTVSNAQARLAFRAQKDKYWQMVGFINASKNDVITERTITMTPREGPQGRRRHLRRRSRTRDRWCRRRPDLRRRVRRPARHVPRRGEDLRPRVRRADSLLQ